MAEIENVDYRMYFRPRKEERGEEGEGSAPCGLICYRANEHE